MANTALSNDNNAMNAPTLGLGFHQFDGNVSVKEVLEQIGGNFTVRKDKIVRLPENLIEAILRGESINVPADYIIDTHNATVCEKNDKFIGVVGADYGVIQNNEGLEILDLISNSSVTDTPMQIVSAGLVHEFEPYFQCKLGEDARINGDTSDTEFYCFFHTSHDGSSALKISLTSTRVICQNTFNYNLRSKNGFFFKHSKNVGERVDLTKEVNIKRVQEVLKELNVLKEEYIQKMSSFRLAKVSDKEIEEFVLNLFVDDEALKREARLHHYNLDLTEASTRTKNVVSAFKDTLESGVGQDTHILGGTKLWLFNGMTNYLSNVANYGSTKDTDVVRATKRFDNLMEGTANRRMQKAMELLTA